MSGSLNLIKIIGGKGQGVAQLSNAGWEVGTCMSWMRRREPNFCNLAFRFITIQRIQNQNSVSDFAAHTNRREEFAFHRKIMRRDYVIYLINGRKCETRDVFYSI